MTLRIRVLAPLAVLLAASEVMAQEARIVSLSGTVSVARGRQAPRPLALADAIQNGDELITGSNSEAVIRAPDGSTVHLFPDSHVIFSEQSLDLREFLHLVLGSVKVQIEKLTGRANPHRVTTPTAVIAVRGTTFSVFVDEEDATLVAVDEGAVAVSARAWPAEEVVLLRGHRCWVRRGERPSQAQGFRGRSERADLISPRPLRRETPRVVSRGIVQANEIRLPLLRPRAPRAASRQTAK
jgi:hypothetical protein